MCFEGNEILYPMQGCEWQGDAVQGLCFMKVS